LPARPDCAGRRNLLLDDEARSAVKIPTVAEYLAYWLEEFIEPNREDGTYSAYELASRLNIILGIGKNG
jgi:hypothetical protein